MRPDEIAQWKALTGYETYEPNSAALGFAMMQGPTFVLVGDDGVPVVAGGLEPIRPKVYQTWMVGTMDGWGKHWRAITKASRRLIDDLLASGEANRVQTMALTTRTEAHEWYRRGLGMDYEATLRGFFSDGSSAALFAKVRE